VLILQAFALLGIGLWLPALETKKLVVSVSSYSILVGIRNLFQAGHWPTGLLVLSFSVLFPVVKLGGLTYVWFARLDDTRRIRLVRLLDALGKWSLLDLFVVAVLLGTVNLGFPSGAQARSGVFVFGGGVVLSMLVTRLVAHAAGVRDAVRTRTHGTRSWLALVVGVAAIVCYVMGLEHALLHTQKWTFWDTDYSVWMETTELLGSAPVLAVLILAVVVVIPLVRMVFVVLRSILSLLGRSFPSWTPGGRCAMGDVFVLAVLVVVTKLSDGLDVSYRVGMAYLAAGVLLAYAGALLTERHAWPRPGNLRSSEHAEL